MVKPNANLTRATAKRIFILSSGGLSLTKLDRLSGTPAKANLGNVKNERRNEFAYWGIAKHLDRAKEFGR